MTSLMGLLLSASPRRRQELARQWAVDGEAVAAHLVTALYRRITDERSLRSFLERLTLEQRMVLQAVIDSPAGEMPVVQLLHHLPIDEMRGRQAIAALVGSALLYEPRPADSLAIPDDLTARLRRGLGATAAAAPTDGALRVRHGAGRFREPGEGPRLAMVPAPRRQSTAKDALLDDLDRLVDAAARGRLPRATSAGRREGRLGTADGDRLAVARAGYAARCARLLGLLVKRSGRLRGDATVSQWQRLGREARARVLFELWLSEREWREPATTPGRRLLLPPARFHRLRQQVCRLLADAAPVVWYSMPSLLAQARPYGAANAPAMDEALVAILAIGFHWLGGVDVGDDGEGRHVAFRLTERGHALVRRARRPGTRGTDGVGS